MGVQSSVRHQVIHADMADRSPGEDPLADDDPGLRVLRHAGAAGGARVDC